MTENVVSVICPYCGAGCGFYLVVDNGRAVGLEYLTEHPVSQGSLCPKGNAALEVLAHPDRLTQPLLKSKGRLQEATWDQALDLIADRLTAIRDSSGADALGFLASAKCSNEENYLFQKLARLLGTNNVDHCARLCHAPTVVGLARTLGSSAMTNPIPDLAHADCILVIGSNFAENHAPVARWVWRAKDQGARVIVADPRLTPTAWLADVFLQLRPGTDVALLNGLMHVIMTEGLADRDFIAQRTTDFDALARHLADYPPSRVAEITGVPPAQIVAAARLLGSAWAATLIYCMGITQHTTGSDNVLACADLTLMCGQIGRPGTGLMPLRGQNNVQGACDMGALAQFYPGYQLVDDLKARNTFASAWGVAADTLSLTPGLTVVEMMHAATEGRLQALYIMGENPLLSDPNADSSREALSELELLVVQDIFLTETAELADVVLPAAAWAEKDGSYTTTERRVQWSPQAVAPPGQAANDTWIISQVAQRLGLQWDGSDSASALAEINQVVPAYGGITPARLVDQSDGLFWPCFTPDDPGTPILHTERFATPDGKARFVPVDYVAPAEEPADAFPFTLTTGRVVVHQNSGSMTRRSPSLLSRAPALFVELNPADGARLGVSDGDSVTVSTVRGQAAAQVRLTDTVESGVAFMPFHFAGTNQLTIDALDPQAKIPEYKVAACQVSPAGGRTER
jgi:formate dehydrogenase major subunit